MDVNRIFKACRLRVITITLLRGAVIIILELMIGAVPTGRTTFEQ